MIRHMSFIRSLCVYACCFASLSTYSASQAAIFDVRPRPVTNIEIAGGAPAGTVYEFYTTTQTDFLSLSLFELSSNYFQHGNGSDSARPMSPLDELFPAITADSWFSAPGNTVMLGDGFQLQSGSGREALWGDLDRTGAVTDFQFGNLTVPHGSSASFSGDFRVANPISTFDTYALDFSVDSAGEFNFNSSDPVPFSKPAPPPTPAPMPIEPQPIDPPTVPAVDPVTPDEEIVVTYPEPPIVVQPPAIVPIEPTPFPITTFPIIDIIDWEFPIIDIHYELPVFTTITAIDLESWSIEATDAIGLRLALPQNYIEDAPSLHVDFDGGANLQFLALDTFAASVESPIPEPRSFLLMLGCAVLSVGCWRYRADVTQSLASSC